MDELTKRVESIRIRYEAWLRAYIKARLYDESDLEDCLQEVFTAYIEKLRQGSEIDNDGAYLARIARNKIVDFNRALKDRRSIISLNELTDQSVGDDFLFSEMSQEKLSRIKETVLSRLSGRKKEIFDLVYIQKHSIKEAAEELGISYIAARKLVSRTVMEIKADLRRELKKQ